LCVPVCLQVRHEDELFEGQGPVSLQQTVLPEFSCLHSS